MGISTGGGSAGAPTDASYVTGQTEAGLSNETVRSNPGDILVSGSFGSSVILSPGFGNWTQVSADNPAFIFCQADVETDGTVRGRVDLRVDESGGTSKDYFLPIALADNESGSGVLRSGTTFAYLPPGAQFKISNVDDPTNNNALDLVRAIVLTP